MDRTLTLLLGSSGCLVLALLVLWAFYTGRLHSDREFSAVVKQRDEYKAALENERKAVDEYARTGSTSNQLIAALTQLAGRQQEPPQGRRGPRGGG